MVTCSDEMRHNFETGDYVTFREIEASEYQLGCLVFFKGAAATK